MSGKPIARVLHRRLRPDGKHVLSIAELRCAGRAPALSLRTYAMPEYETRAVITLSEQRDLQALRNAIDVVLEARAAWFGEGEPSYSVGDVEPGGGDATSAAGPPRSHTRASGGG